MSSVAVTYFYHFLVHVVIYVTNIEQCFKFKNTHVRYLALVVVFLCCTGLLDQTKCKLQ